MFKAKGKLIYDPKSEKADRKGFEFWWMKLDVPPSIVQYYQYWIRRELGIHLNTPIWKAHVTVVRGEEPRRPVFWKRYQNELVEFEYSPEFKISETYAWLTVKSERLSEIRAQLGLRPEPRVPFHITIGNTKNVVPKKEVAAPFRIFPWEDEKVACDIYRNIELRRNEKPKTRL